MATTVVPWVTGPAAATGPSGGPGTNPCLRRRAAKSGPGSSPGENVGICTKRRLLATLLHVGADEVLSVGFQHLVYLVEEIVDVGLQLLTGVCSCRCFGHLIGGPSGGRLALLLSFSHVGPPSSWSAQPTE